MEPKTKKSGKTKKNKNENGYAQSIDKQSGESVESVLMKNKKAK